jgi:hypothetical protein
MAQHKPAQISRERPRPKHAQNRPCQEQDNTSSSNDKPTAQEAQEWALPRPAHGKTSPSPANAERAHGKSSPCPGKAMISPPQAQSITNSAYGQRRISQAQPIASPAENANPRQWQDETVASPDHGKSRS